MGKVIIIVIFGVALIVGLSLGLTRTQESSQPDKKPPKAGNIDSLIAGIEHDPVYHIHSVHYYPKDSSLELVVNAGPVSIRYFDSAYKLQQWPQIDGIQIVTINGEQLARESKRGDRLLNLFKQKWCTQNQCEPMARQIKMSIHPPDGYRPDKVWVQWLGDSSFLVTCSYWETRNGGKPIHRKAHAQVGMDGKIQAYDQMQ